MILFSADIRQAQACSDDAITTSSVGIPVKLILASDFNGLAKTVVFRNGTASADVALVGDATETTVPVNVLVTTGQLRIGIYAADGNGTIVIPTVWAMAGIVKQGAVPSGVDPSDPVPNWVAQVQSIASQASEDASDALTIAQGVKAQADAGDFDGAPGQDGTDGTDGYSPTVSVEEIPGGHEVTITDINGEHSFEVLDGQGGGGSSDYNDLSNKPQIAGTTLSGNKSLADLGIAAASDIPSVPVQSVNGETGDVVLDAEDVGALPDDTVIPTKTSDLENDSGFLTSAPVTSVNSKTGAVTLNASDVGAYSKPSGGIPSSDMASAVQTSLGKADTAYQKPNSGIPAADLASGVIPTVPTAYTSNPAALGTASPGSSTSWARGDHVHAKPTYSKSDVGLGNVDNVQQYSATNPPPYPVTSVNGQTGAVVLDADDVGAEPAVIEVTISTSGAVTQALDAGKIYHFTGAVTSLSLTLNAASGQLAQYHFDFVSGSTATTVTLTGVTWPEGSFTPEANKRYEVDILNGYGVAMAWANS